MIAPFYETSLNDSPLVNALQGEATRREDCITLIASENYMSDALITIFSKALLLNDKYAEGYPGARYYGGCTYADDIENLAIARAKQLFEVEYANVQPHSGSQANAAVLSALLQPGECLLGMHLKHGGHLTHGAKVNFSGKLYRAATYGVNPQGLIDYDQVTSLAEQYRPRVIIAGYSAYSRKINWARFRDIADRVGAILMADISHIAGLVAAKEHPSPVPFADVITATTHKTLRGPRGGLILVPKEHFAKAKRIDHHLFPGLQGGPLMHVIAAKAAAFQEALQPNFKHYQQQIIRNAQAMANTFIERGFFVVSGGTDNHLFLLDLRAKKLLGSTAEKNLEAAHIIVNKNVLPQDPQPASITSGIRIGTAAITSRGCQESEVKQITHWIADVLEHPGDEHRIFSIKEKVTQLCQNFPIHQAKNI